MQQNVASAIASGLEMVPCPSCKKRHHLQRKDLPHHLQTIAARSAEPSTKTVDKATAASILASRKKGLKAAKKIKPLPAMSASTVSATPEEMSKPKAKQPKVRTTPRNSAQVTEVPELVTERLPATWKNPELPHAGTFAALAKVQPISL